MKYSLGVLVVTSAVLFGSVAFAGGSYIGNGYVKDAAQDMEDYAKCIGNNPVNYCLSKAK